MKNLFAGKRTMMCCSRFPLDGCDKLVSNTLLTVRLAELEMISLLVELNRKLQITLGMAIFCSLAAPWANSQTTVQDLRRLARNPFANVINVPIEEDIYFGGVPFSRSANSLQVQPVFPFRISEDWLLVPRIVAPVMVYLPDVTSQSGGTLGLGDANPTFYFSPANAKKIVWGVGPSLLMPTATSPELGSGKWAIGPSAAVLTQPHWGFLGVLVQNIWSFGGDPHRTAVKQMLFQYQFSYDLPRGWYLTTAPTISADWTQVRDDRWVVPFGAGVGRTFKIGKQGIDVNLSLYRNVILPGDQTFPKWQLSLQASFIFPIPNK